MIHPITISDGDESRWGKLGRRSKEGKLSQHHPRKQLTRAGQSYLATAHGVGPGRAETLVKHGARCNRSQTHRGNPATHVSAPNISTSVNPARCVPAKTSQTVHQRRRGLIKTTSDSCRHPHLFCSLRLCRGRRRVSSQVATRQVSLNVPVVLGRNKMFTTHSEAWRGLEALFQPVHFLNKHHLFGGCSTSFFVQRLPAPHLQMPQSLHC